MKFLLLTGLLISLSEGYGQMPSFTATIANQNVTSACADVGITFTNTSSVPTANLKWDFGDGKSLTGDPSISYSYSSAGTYTVTLTNTAAPSNIARLQITIFKKPVADFTISNTTTCVGSATALTSTSSVGDAPITNYQWTYGDGGALNTSQSSATHIYNNAGKYTPSLVVTDRNGCTASSSASTPIQVNGGDITTGFEANGTNFYSCNNDIAFTNISKENGKTGISYQWNFGDETTSTEKNPAHTYSNAGAYTVTLTALEEGSTTGCAPVFVKTVYIGRPTLSLQMADEVCQSTAVPIEITAQPAIFAPALADIKWSATNGSVNTNNKTVTFNTAGPNTITGTTQIGCPTTISKTVTVNAVPKLTLSLSPNKGICLSIPVQATATVSNDVAIQQFQWYPEGTSQGVKGNSADGTFEYQYSTAGNYTFAVIATSDKGCVNPAVTTAVVISQECIDNGNGSAYNPVFSFKSKSCDDKYTIILQSKVSGETVDYWTIDGVRTNATDNKADAVIPNQTPQAVHLVVTHYKNRPSDQKYITIIDETPDFDINPNNSAGLYCATNNISFSTAAYINPQNIKTFKWQIINSSNKVLQTSANATFSYAFPSAGNYTVQLDITDLNGCPGTISKQVSIQGLSASFTANSTTFCYYNPEPTFKADITQGPSPLKTAVWTFGDGQTETVETPAVNNSITHAYIAPSVNYKPYNVQLTVEDQAGCKSTKTQNSFIKIYQPQVNFTTKDTLLCSTRTIRIANLSNASGGKYTWTIGNESVNGSANVKDTLVYTFKNVNTSPNFDVSLKVIDGGGCTKDTTIAQYIRFRQPSASFNIPNDSLLNNCPAYTLQLVNTSVNKDSAVWSINDDFTSYQLDSIYYTVLHPGPLKIQLKALLDGCESVTNTENIIKGPIAQLTIDKTIGCLPLAANIDITHNDDVVSYQWNFGDDSSFVSTTQDQTRYMYSKEGTFNPYVKVTGKEGCTDKLEYKDPVVVGNPKAVIAIADSSTFCYSSPIKFLNKSVDAESPFQFTGFEWHWGSTKENNDSKDTIRHTFSQSTVPYQVFILGKTAYCTVSSDTLTISPGLVPSLTINGEEGVCMNDSLNLTGLVNNTENDNNTFHWTYGEQSVSGINASAFRAQVQPEVKDVLLQVTTEKGCSAETTKDMQYWAFPTVTINQPEAFCTGTSVQLQAASDGSIFQWTSAKEIAQGNTLTPTIQPDSSAYYYLTVKNENNCQNTDSIFVIVDQKVNLRAEAHFNFCLNDTIPLLLETVADQASRYMWTALPASGYMSDPTASSVHVRPEETTTYHLIAYSANTCPDEEKDILVSALIYPKISFSPQTEEVSAGTEYPLRPVITDEEGAKYSWTPTYHLDKPSLKNPKALIDNSITYRLTVTNDNGCYATDSISLQVLCSSTKIFMANAFTPNGDGVNDKFYVTGYGIQKVDHFIIIDRWGKKVFERNNIAANDINQGWDGRINGHLAAPGTYMYFAQIECNEGNKIPIKGSIVLIR